MREPRERYLLRCLEAKPEPKVRTVAILDLRTKERKVVQEEVDDDRINPEEALRLLKVFTKQDFGLDVEKWREWIDKNIPKW